MAASPLKEGRKVDDFLHSLSLLIVLLLLLCIEGCLLSKLLNHALYAIVEFNWHIEGCKLVNIEPAFSLSEEHFIVKATLLYFVELVLLEPLNALALLPQAKLRRLAGHFVRAEAVLFTSAPVTGVRTPVCPCVDAKAMFFVVLVLSSILTTVLPSVNADTIHVIVYPLALELAPVEPSVRAQAADLVLLPLAIVPRPVIPAVNAFSVLFTGEVLTFID